MVYEMNDRATMKVAFPSLPLTGHLNPMHTHPIGLSVKAQKKVVGMVL